MNVTIEEKDDALVAILEGRLDTAAAATTEKELSQLYNANGKNIVFDCKQLQYISSSGLRIFLGVLKSAQPKGSHVRIINLNDDLKNIFFMTGFNNLFEFA